MDGALTCIAITGERFADFRPYVAAIDEAGVVAFQATVAGGGTGVYTGTGGPITAAFEAPGEVIGTVRSHPDVSRAGDTSFYVDLASGGGALVRVREGRASVLAEAGPRFADIGPLGPTMNERGLVAFRATTRGGTEGVFTSDGVTIAETGGALRAFDGLPCVNEGGAVAVRAETSDGRQVIALHDGTSLAVVVSTGDRFGALGRFPSLDDGGRIAFCATACGGEQGIYEIDGGEVRPLVTDPGLESYRGVLISDAGPTVLYATPRGGTLGIYRRLGNHIGRLLGIGDPLYGTRVAAFVLNPVSMNRSGQLAIRLELDDGRQAIVRAG